MVAGFIAGIEGDLGESRAEGRLRVECLQDAQDVSVAGPQVLGLPVPCRLGTTVGDVPDILLPRRFPLAGVNAAATGEQDLFIERIRAAIEDPSPHLQGLDQHVEMLQIALLMLPDLADPLDRASRVLAIGDKEPLQAPLLLLIDLRRDRNIQAIDNVFDDPQKQGELRVERREVLPVRRVVDALHEAEVRKDLVDLGRLDIAGMALDRRWVWRGSSIRGMRSSRGMYAENMFESKRFSMRVCSSAMRNE
ncbi:MAG: hypothetical protein NTW68_19000 [candidate division NC10 bacterium]|nr:hypothetical protein [candidate division NC10 bacterium]